jgi:alpha,alpha-trehalose phosphorylase
MLYRGRRLRVEMRPGEATYELLEGEPIDVHHHGARITLSIGEPVVRTVPPAPPVAPVSQPPGRAPQRRSTAGANR